MAPLSSVAALAPRDSVPGSRVGLVRVFWSLPIPLIVASTGLRLYMKLSKKIGLTSDDIFIILASISILGECIAILGVGVQHGFGRHITTVSERDLVMYLKAAYAYSHFYDCALASVKLSILCFYYRIFTVPLFRRIVVIFIVFTVAWVIGITIALGLVCTPLRHFWEPSVPGTCVDLVAFTYFTNISNLVTDILIFLLPVPLIWRLQLPFTRRLALVGVFSIGLGSCVLSMIRLRFVVAQASTDTTWDAVPLGAFSLYEPLGGLLCANLPVVYPLLAERFRTAKTRFVTMTPSRKLHASTMGNTKRYQGGVVVTDSNGIVLHRTSDGESITELVDWDGKREKSGIIVNTTRVVGQEESSLDKERLPANSIMVEHKMEYEVEHKTE